jgi:hypothetical protein
LYLFKGNGATSAAEGYQCRTQSQAKIARQLDIYYKYAEARGKYTYTERREEKEEKEGTWKIICM